MLLLLFLQHCCWNSHALLTIEIISLSPYLFTQKNNTRPQLKRSISKHKCNNIQCINNIQCNKTLYCQRHLQCNQVLYPNEKTVERVSPVKAWIQSESYSWSSVSVSSRFTVPTRRRRAVYIALVGIFPDAICACAHRAVLYNSSRLISEKSCCYEIDGRRAEDISVWINTHTHTHTHANTHTHTIICMCYYHDNQQFTTTSIIITVFLWLSG